MFRKTIPAATFAISILAWTMHVGVACGQGVTERVLSYGDPVPNGDGVALANALPFLNNNGDMAFETTLTGTSAGGFVESIYFRAGSSKELTEIVRDGDIPPEGDGAVSFLNVNAFNDAGQIAILGGITAGALFERAVYRADLNGLVKIVRVGDPFPDGNGSVTGIGADPSGSPVGGNAIAINAAGEVATTVLATGNQPGIVRGNGVALESIERIGTHQGQLSGPRLSDAGQIAFIEKNTANTVAYNPHTGLPIKQSAVVLFDGARQQIAAAATPLPTSDGGYDEFYPSIHEVALNNHDHVAFTATFANSTSNSFGIFLYDGTSTSRVVQNGDAAPDGNGDIFLGLNTFLRLNDSNQMAFGTRLTNTSGGSADDHAIYRRDANGVTTIVRKGDLVGSGAEVFTNVAGLGGGDGGSGFAMNDAGAVAFHAGVGPAGREAIFLSDGRDLLQVGPREGDRFEGSFVRSVRFNAGTGAISGFDSSFNNLGQLAYFVQTTDLRNFVELFTPDLFWRNDASGSWDDGANWTLSLDPAYVHHASISPDVDVVVTGPSQDTTVKSLTLGGGSGSVELKLQAGVQLAVTDGLTVSDGVTLGGNGGLDADAIIEGIISPGDSPGSMFVSGDVTWAPGGTYLWEINDAFGTAGSDPGWDLLAVDGTLNITATASDPFNIQITSLLLSNLAGALFNFDDSRDFRWTIATATGGILGFDPSLFFLDTSGFSNPFDGIFGIASFGNSLELTFTSNTTGSTQVPEPSSFLLFVTGIGTLLAGRRLNRVRRET